MGLLAIAVRGIVAYAFLLILMRASGKRTIAESSPFDFVVALILGDMVDDLLWADVGLAQFAVATGTLVIAQTALAAGQVRCDRLHSWVTGDAAVLLRDGRPVAARLRRERIRQDELEAHLRVCGLEREKWGDVALARLEGSGAVTVRKVAPAEPVERGDLTEEGR